MAAPSDDAARTASVSQLRLSDQERDAPASPRRTVVAAVVGAIAAALIAFALTRGGGSDARLGTPPGPAPAADPGAAPAMNVAPAAAPARGAPILAGGRVEAGRRAELSPGRSGVVAAIKVARGVRVPAGTVLAELDNDAEEAGVEVRRAAVEALTARLNELRDGARPEDLESARGEVTAADAIWREARARAERDRVLSEKGALTSSQLLQSETAEESARARLAQARSRLQLLEKGARPTSLAAAQAEVARAKAELAQAEAALRATRLLAPSDGSILEVRLNPGETFAPGMGPALLVFGDLDHLIVKADIPETQATRLKVGDRAVAAVEALAPKTFPARIEEIALEADRQKGTVEVTAALLEKDARIRPRMSARLSIASEEER